MDMLLGILLVDMSLVMCIYPDEMLLPYAPLLPLPILPLPLSFSLAGALAAVYSTVATRYVN